MQTTTATLPSLHEASRALWLATLSLMTAFMHTPAPAHRLMLARRIARNFETLRQQECFTLDCREKFAQLGARWQRKVDLLKHVDQPAPQGLLQRAQRLLGLG